MFCSLGGLVGAFVGGLLFNYVCKVIPNDVVARGVAIVIMGILIGVGVGLLEQFAKQAWLKVIRGEFEGKEYLVFAGTTSIGNNGKNTIVLFKDKLVGPHHCDISRLRCLRQRSLQAMRSQRCFGRNSGCSGTELLRAALL